ncbi:MAG: molybdopterin-dependent oxidoreductase, partial [Acidimicrobiia bacterium]|nr:molybdopterin-dependent oxidoreductase [Acidimicrobiia bacterium]
DVVFAAAAFGEQSGTTTNLEGRVTSVAEKVTPAGTARPDWMVAAELAERLGHDDLASRLWSVEAITDEIATTVPAYSAATSAAIATAVDGVLAVPASTGTVGRADGAPTVTDRVSYDYRLVITRKLYDRAIGTAMSPSLASLAAAGAATVHPLDLARLGIETGADVQLIGHRGSVVLPIAASVGVPQGSVHVPFNVAGASATDIVDATSAVHDVRIERLADR